MICPVCNQVASSFLRNTFSKQGVSTFESFKGLLTCQQCGARLRTTSFQNQFWVFVGVFAIILSLFAILYPSLLQNAGSGVTTAVWVILMLVVLLAFTYGMWKYSRLEKAEG